jgi:type I restriction enzyme S subunit
VSHAAKPVFPPLEADSWPIARQWSRLDDLCEGVFDCPHTTPVITEEGPYVVRSQDVRTGIFRLDQAAHVSEETYQERIARAEPRFGDILYSREGTYFGLAAEVPRGVRVCLGQRMVLIRPSDKIDTRFLRLWLNSPVLHRHIMGFRDGTVAERLNMPTIRGLPVPHISLPEQRAIAATLGALDDKIELNRKMNATLEAMARALFRDWFVDFGPTRAKMEGAAPYLSPDLWSLFPARLDAEGKPEGWEMGTLNDLASLNPESWTARNAPAQVSYVDLANTKWGSIDKVEVYDWANAPSRARRILRAGDTIVGTVRPGNGSFCYVGEDGFTGSTGFAVLRPLQPRDRAFVWCAATSAENIDRLAHLADGGAYPAVRPDAVAATEVVIPGSGVLEAFRAAVSANLDLMEANKAESLTLAQTRDLLLPRLMSGELRVAEAERLAEEVA